MELHVEQGRDLVDRDAAVGLATGIWPHGRYRFDFTGEANHAGTTRMEDRHDPMLTYAMTALAAAEQARLAGPAGHLRPGRRRAQRHQRDPLAGDRLARRPLRQPTTSLDRARRGDQAPGRRAGAAATAPGSTVTPESVSGAVAFDPALTARLRRGLAGRWGEVPVIPTMAGHDAGILAAAGVPTAMLFVRNPTGVSHSPDEHAETADCLAGVEALADALEVLVS